MIVNWLGSSSRIKVIEFLINNKDNSFSIREIIKGAQVKHRNLVYILHELIKYDMAYIAKKVGKSSLYKINIYNDLIQGLMFSKGLRK